MEHTEDIKNWLSMQAPKVKSNIEVVGSDSGLKMMHISYNTKPKRFIPVIGYRQNKQEDRTVPRVCVAPSLQGCIMGYAAFEHHTSTLDKNKKDEHGITYYGGFKLYKFEYEFAIKPNEKLVYDQKMTDEHWLVTYNKDTVFYVPIEIGELFVRKIETEFGPDTLTVLYFVKVNEVVVLSINNILQPGCYRVKSPASYMVKNWGDDEKIKVSKIPEEEYFKAKTETAAMLSLEGNANPPKFSHW